MMFKRRRLAAMAAAITVIVNGTGIQLCSPSLVSAAEESESISRIRVDINKNDGRKASYAKNANNWILVDGASPAYELNGITFQLSNGGSVGGDVTGTNNKKLQLQSLQYPYLTMDGAKIKDGDDGGVLKLEISGLSNENHSLQMWHCNTDGYTNSNLSISVNGKKVLSGVNCPTNVKDEKDAGISYVTWSGSSVTILITPEGGGTQDVAWLNAFELDGSDPVNGVSRMYPDDQCAHLDTSKGLSWTAGENAQSHDVYIGTNYSEVFNADHNSKEFKGNQTATTYSLDDSYSSIPTYYWRIDEVNSSGIVKGAVYSFQVNRLAFPTAEGYGRFARGGRGGYVYHVTNLNDSGEGSLRYGLETLKGARTIVFDVGGVISLNSVLCIPDDGGDVYVAGQTAPGDGITLINYTFGAMGSKDVIIRDIRTRVGDVSGKSMGGMGLGSCDNSIIDHCSISWGTDEGFSSRSAANITFQWSIIAESLNNSVHYNADDRNDVERHAFAASISGYTGSFHHNLLIHNTGRNWSLAGAMEQDAVTYGGQLDIRNNVVYNWQERTTDGGVRRLNFVNNYYKAGPVSNTNMHIVSIDGNELNTSDMQKMYVSGNVMADIKGNQLLKATDDAWAQGKAVSGGKNSTEQDVRSDTPFFESYVNTQSAEEAYDSVITNAGANTPGFDYLDSRYLTEVKNGTYTYKGSKDGLQGIIDSQEDVGGYPTNSTFKGGTAPKDTDQDGMPDAWETEHGLNPNDASDGAIVSLSGDDYTNLEMYLNELAGDPVEYNGNITREPITGSLIKSIDVKDTTYYSSWAIDTSLEIGDKVFGDRTIEKSAYSEVPNKYQGAEHVLTPCDSKNSEKEQAELTAAEDITVFVGFDTRITSIPSWVNGWTKETETIKTSNGITFEVYSKDIKADETITLGSNGQANGVVNYIVLAAKENISSPIILGDLNCDDCVNVFDLAMYKQYIHGTRILEGQALANADINNDGNQNIADLILLQKFLLGRIKNFNN